MDKNKDIPRLAVDTNVIIDLTIYDKYCPHIHKILVKNDFETATVEEKILNDNFLCKRYHFKDSKNGRQSKELYFISRLYELMKNGDIEIFITPTVFGELGLADKTMFNSSTLAGNLSKTELLIKQFLEKESTNIHLLNVNEEDNLQFEMDKLELAKEYSEEFALSRIYSPMHKDYIPSTDAFIMAEASLFGLFFVTQNEKHFIHMDCKGGESGWGDYLRAHRVEQINARKGLFFPTNTKKAKEPIRPLPLDSMIRRILMGKFENKTIYTYPNIDEKTGEILPTTLN